MTRLHDVHTEQGQSVWIDNLRRGYITGGGLQRLIDDGVRGVTSNPTIFQKAISEGSDYDAQFAQLIQTHTVQDAYWELVIEDITNALAITRAVYDESDGGDGYVSLEVAPSLAHDTAATIDMARGFHHRIDTPNLMVKIPATEEGAPAIEQMIAEGRCINVTLIFSLTRYAKVIEAYLAGLERCEGDLSKVASVASFFISRVDTEVDRRLDAIATPAAQQLHGKAAVAQGQLAYKLFLEKFSGPRWEALVARGARVQRPLWASTSTKNPNYDELLYVNTLIGPDTVNTMPEPTVGAFMDHGVVARTVDADLAGSQRVFDELGAVGVDLADVANTIEEQGVSSFVKSFDELLSALQDKAGMLGANQ